MEKLLAKKPENYLQVIKRSLFLYKKSFKQIYLLAFSLAIIVFIPRFLSIIIGQDIFFGIDAFNINRIWQFLINLVALMLFLSMLWCIHGIIDQLHEPLKDDLIHGIKKVFSVFIAALIQTFILGFVFVFVFLISQCMHYYMPQLSNNFFTMALFAILLSAQFFLMLYVYTLFVFLAPLILIENKGIISALRRSISLVWNHWWRTFSIQATPWLCYLLALIFTRYILSINIHI